MGCSWAVLVGVGLLLFGEVVEAVSDEREEVLAADLQVVRGDDGLVDLRGEQVVTGGFLEQRVAVFEEAAFARKRLDDALRFEFGVGLGDGVAVDAELLGERADAGERPAGPQRAVARQREGGKVGAGAGANAPIRCSRPHSGAN